MIDNFTGLNDVKGINDIKAVKEEGGTACIRQHHPLDWAPRWNKMGDRKHVVEHWHSVLSTSDLHETSVLPYHDVYYHVHHIVSVSAQDLKAMGPTDLGMKPRDP